MNFFNVLIFQEITSSKLELSNLKPNLAAIKEWRLKHSEFESRKQELDEVTEQRDSKRKTYEELRKKRYCTIRCNCVNRISV
jgi:hypothetical protein